MTSTTKPTFEVSKEGLAALLERRGGKSFAITELVQNAWDEDVTRVDVSIKPDERSGPDSYIVVVEDDSPDGFKDLSHAYTLFAESAKKGDASKRGRFNLGEKFVIAICDEARIETTTGTVNFTPKGRTHTKAVRDRGSRFRGDIRMTKDDYESSLAAVRSLIVPPGIDTFLNGVLLEPVEALASFRCSLQTERADQDGVLRRSARVCTVEVYEPTPGQTPSLYELGIPVVETGDRWHVNVLQKVPLNMDRDNVTPAYLRTLRAEVLNHVHEFIRPDDASENWVREAITDPRATGEAIDAALTAQYGEARVVFDPSDLEANKRAAAAGFTVIPARGLPKGVAARARDFGVLAPSGAVTPSPRPYEFGEALTRSFKPEAEWDAAERHMADYSIALAQRLIGRTIKVVLVDDPKCMSFSATYRQADGQLEFNRRVLGKAFFAAGPTVEANALIIHELAHNVEADHLSDRFVDACCVLGAKLGRLALDDPDFLRAYESVRV